MSSFFRLKNKPAIVESRIMVTGRAKNINDHAAVVSDSADIYIIEGMQEWQQHWLGQTVRITGDIIRMDHTIPDNGINSIKIIKEAIIVLLYTGRKTDQ
jgi:hypothetical protein